VDGPALMPPQPAPAPAPASAPGADPAAPAPHAPHASTTPSRHGNRGREAHATARSDHREVAPGPPAPAAGAVAVGGAATARPAADLISPAASRRTLPGSFEIPAPEASASLAASGGPDRSAPRAGSQALPTHALPLVGAVCTAVLAAVGIAAACRRRPERASPARAGTSSVVPGPAAASKPVPVSSEPPVRPPRPPSPRCALRSGPRRPPRRRIRLVAAS
jgi:hypothetical protein